MSDGRYYWLKLKRDFFKRHDIRIVEDMPNGKEYILFYLKLLCESVDHDGNLRFSDEIPYNENMLATITNTNKDIVVAAVKMFTDLHMMEILDDGTIYMREVSEMIGSASDTDNANRQRRFRERKKLMEIEAETPSEPEETSENVTQALQERYASVTKNNESKSKSKSKSKNNDYLTIINLFAETCPSFPSVKVISDSRKKAIRARLNKYTIDDFRTLFEKAEASDFLKGGNDRNWTADFDWLIKDSNMPKVLEGKYDNREKRKDEWQFTDFI